MPWEDEEDKAERIERMIKKLESGMLILAAVKETIATNNMISDNLCDELKQNMTALAAERQTLFAGGRNNEDFDRKVVIWAENLTKMRLELEKKLDALDAKNSAYPATKEFLEKRGLKRVSELDGKGKEELRQYLEEMLRNLLL